MTATTNRRWILDHERGCIALEGHDITIHKTGPSRYHVMAYGERWPNEGLHYSDLEHARSCAVLRAEDAERWMGLFEEPTP